MCLMTKGERFISGKFKFLNIICQVKVRHLSLSITVTFVMF